MTSQIKTAAILVPALIMGVIIATLVSPPADGTLIEKIPYWAIGFFIGSVPVAVGIAWLIKKLGL